MLVLYAEAQWQLAEACEEWHHMVKVTMVGNFDTQILVRNEVA